MKITLCFLIFLTTGLFAFSQTDRPTASELMTSYFQLRDDALGFSSKKISAEKQAELNELVEKIKAFDEESFEYNYVLYVNGNYNTELSPALFKAYAFDNTNEGVIKEMLGFYVLTSNTAKQKEFLTKVQKFYTAAEIAYYADALPDSKAIVVTSNQEDMYGFLVAQQVNGIATNVQVINMDFMKNATYRKMVSATVGITDQDFVGNEKTYLKTMLRAATSKVYISATVPQDYLSLVSDNVFLTGLSYQYGSIDQFTALNEFWLKIKTKDMSQLALTRYSEKYLYANYLPPLLTLYMLQPDDPVLKLTIEAIAAKTGKTAEVNELLKDIETD